MAAGDITYGSALANTWNFTSPNYTLNCMLTPTLGVTFYRSSSNTTLANIISISAADVITKQSNITISTSSSITYNELLRYDDTHFMSFDRSYSGSYQTATLRIWEVDKSTNTITQTDSSYLLFNSTTRSGGYGSIEEISSGLFQVSWGGVYITHNTFGVDSNYEFENLTSASETVAIKHYRTTSPTSTDVLSIGYRDGSGSYKYDTVLYYYTRSGSTYTYRSQNVILDEGSQTAFIETSLVKISDTKVAVVYKNNSSDICQKIVTINGSTMSVGSETVIDAGTHYSISTDYVNADKTYVLMSFRDSNNSSYGSNRFGTISTTGITWSSTSQFTSSAIYYAPCSTQTNIIDDGKMLLSYADGTSKTNSLLVANVEVTVSDYEYSGSGTIQSSGEATTSYDITYNKEYIPTGGLVTLGSGAVETDQLFTGSGIVTSSGLASVEIGYTTTGSGLVQTSGAADTQGEDPNYVGSGNIYTSGEASTYTVSPLRIGYPMVLTGSHILGVENLDDTHVAYLYSDDNGSYINIATYNGNAELEYAALSYSVPQPTAYRYKISALSATKLLVSYFITGVGVYTVIADIAGTVVTFGDEWYVPSSDQTNPHDIHELSDDTFVITFRDYNIDETVVSKGAVSGTDISFGNFEYSPSSVSTEWADIVKINSISIILIESPTNGLSQATYVSLTGTPSFYNSLYIPDSNNRVSGFGLNNNQYVLFYNNYSNNVSVICTLTGLTSSFGTQYPTGYNYYNSFDITKLDDKFFALGFRESDNSAVTLIGEIDDDVITYDHYTKYSDTSESVFTTKLDSRKYVLSNKLYPPTIGHSLDSHVAVLDGTFITPNYVGSGTIHTSGSSQVQADFIMIGSGDVQTSGEALININKYYDGSGTVDTSGNASVEVHYITTGSGVVQSSGSATAQIDYSYSGSGVVQTSGSALVELGSEYTGSGIVQASGSADTEEFNEYEYAGSGVVQASGEAEYVYELEYMGSGVVQTSGSAGTDIDKDYIGSGTVQASGTAASESPGGLVYIGSGTVYASGSADINIDREFTGSGIVQASGEAEYIYELEYIGSGIVQSSGSADTEEFNEYGYAGSGIVQASGEADINIDREYVGSGTVQASGSASIFIDIYNFIGSGTVHASGSAQVDFYTYYGSGTVYASGSALVEFYPSSKEVIVVESILDRHITVDSSVDRNITVDSLINREITVRSYL